jgi:hypothetical protein
MASEPNERGQYGASADSNGKGNGGAVGILAILGITVGIYALSPGARHYYKHGYLPHR